MPPADPSGALARHAGIPSRTVPLLYFVLAHAALVITFLAAVSHAEEVSGFFYQPRVVALVHLVTLGWITASILGSLYVIAPMALKTPLPGRRLDVVIWLLFAVGVSGMASHFWINSYGGVGWSALLALAAALHVGTRVERGMRTASLQKAVKICFSLANLNLLLAGGLGALLAFDKAHPFLPAKELGNVFAHAHLAAAGWAGMMVMGVGLRMIPMILPSAMPKGNPVLWGAVAMEAGLIGLSVALMLGSRAAGICALLIAAGLTTFLAQIAWMLRNRRPPPAGLPRPDLGVLHVAQALTYLVLCLGLGLFLAFSEPSPLSFQLAPLYGVLGLLGFLGQLVIGVEARILPMFAAYHANRGACNAGPVILPHQMVSRQLQWAALLGWSAGIPLLAAGLSLASVSLVRGGSSLLLAGTLAMSLNAAFVFRHLFARTAPTDERTVSGQQITI
jgi:hypothetical protein